MEFLNKKTFLMFMVLALVCTACGPHVIRGRPPFISIASLNLDGEQLTAVFNISNQNGEPMDIDGVNIDVQVEDVYMTRHNRDLKLSIDANSTEEVVVNELPDQLTQKLLASLEKGEIISLPFSLEGRVHTLADGNMKFQNKGHLYPVPGRPGHFRSATTHSNRIDSEDPFKEVKNRQ